ncbi:MAG: alpha-D-ribose 1-methylphosphonate 5-triphosphate diphosphatase [Azospirillum sp.]|nr:alpha-D-ribose 1-methylphosphonate 5-triphosphate diphosphatase [Azospirillum sp.]
MSLILTNARIVTRDEVFSGTVELADGLIRSVETGRSRIAGAVDCAGDTVLPGLIEMHTDHLEKHLSPRPGIVWPSPVAAVLAHDAQITAAGITTVFDALTVGDDTGGSLRHRLLPLAVQAIRDAGQAGLLRADHRLHLRCEVSDPRAVEVFEILAGDPLVRLVSVMDHTPGQRQWRDMRSFLQYYELEGASDAELEDLMERRARQQALYSDRHRRAILDRVRALGLPAASHDDTTEAHVAEAGAAGVTISEFPTTLAAAKAARRHGLAVIMGAPNIVRGGSHSGNVSALELADHGLLDGLSSDYMPTSLLHAAFLLADRLDGGLPAAVATVSAGIADRLALDDRGSIAIGRRADLIRVRSHHGLPVVHTVWRQGLRVI